jgi:hypothetical protein
VVDEVGIRLRYEALGPVLDERTRRRFAAAEAQAAGWGGIAAVARVIGMARSTIIRGLAELAAGIDEDALARRVRRPGGGRKKLTQTDATLLSDLRGLVEPTTRGDPEAPLLWTSHSLRSLTEAEADVFRVRQSSPVYVLGHSVACVAGAPGFRGRAGFLFVGRLLEQKAPNWQGLSWFVRECWPLIRVSLPNAMLSVVGHLHPDHAALEAPGVRLLGPVADLRPLYDAARVFIAPVRFAAGMPIKILEATAAGLPSAGTRLMARQLAWTPGVEMMAGDDADAFAAAAMVLHEDAAAWEATRAAAQRRVRREYTASVFRERLQAVLDGLPLSQPPAAGP